MSSDKMEHHPLPPGPPPLLNEEQISLLCMQGWLIYDLPHHLRQNIDELNKIATAFFNTEADAKIASLAGKHKEEEGWYDVPGEKEYVTFRRSLSSSSSLEQQAGRVWREVTRLLHRVLCDLSRAGELPIEVWDSIVAGAMSFPAHDVNLRDATSLMRLFKYMPGTGIAEQHTDLGLLTLCVGTDHGLELKHMHPQQSEASWADGSNCTILVGEVLRRLSSNNICAGMHRVVGNPSGRQSFVFALRPNLSATVDASHFGGVGTFDLRKIFLEIKGSKYNVNARQEVRKKQQDEKRAAAVAPKDASGA